MQYTVEAGIPHLVDFWSLVEVKDLGRNIWNDELYLDGVIENVAVILLTILW